MQNLRIIIIIKISLSGSQASNLDEITRGQSKNHHYYSIRLLANLSKETIHNHSVGKLYMYFY